MLKILPKSLFGQLLFGTILVQTLLLALFIWHTVDNIRRGSEERAHQRVVQQLGQVSAACAVELEQRDQESLQNVLNLSRIGPSIAVARLTDLSGRTLAVTENAQPGLDASESAVLSRAVGQQLIFKRNKNQLEGVTPVLVNGKPVALVWLEQIQTSGASTIHEVIQIATTYGGFALLANILPFFLIVRTMTRPLLRLRNATEQVIRDPELSAGFPLPVTATNEAGDLTASFNFMVQQLQQQRQGLLETLALLNSMLRNAPIGFAFFDHDLRYVRVNDFLADLHGFPIEEHLGKTPAEIYPAFVAEPKLEHLQRVFDTGMPMRNVQLSGELPQGSGVQRSWMMHFYPVRADEDAIRWVGVIVVEITDQLRADEALRKTEKLAATGRLAASIAHEINNPLEAMTNILYILQTHETLDETAVDLVATAQSELTRVAEITQQTLRFYRQSTSPARVNIADILNSVLGIYQRRIQSASIVVKPRFQGDPETFGFGGELRQVFANLVSNALDAMPLGGTLWLSAHYGHGRDANGLWRRGIRVCVTDTGSGMSEETRRRIFEPFFTTKEATGTGLGLWVSDEIVRRHKGTIQVRSRRGEGSGTNFMIFIPDSRREKDAALETS